MQINSIELFPHLQTKYDELDGILQLNAIAA